MILDDLCDVDPDDDCSSMKDLVDSDNDGEEISDMLEAPPESKPESVGGPCYRWKHPKLLRKLNFEIENFDRIKPDMPPGLEPSKDKEFEEMMVGELRQSMAYLKQLRGKWEDDSTDGLCDFLFGGSDWSDANPELKILEQDVEQSEPSKILNLSWKTDEDQWQGKKWVRVDSVVDSGACAPLAPPSMVPNVPIEPSEGSKRGQRWTSASKHKIKNLGQRKIHACIESGEMTDVMLEVADVGKPLISVSALCERGNRVLFGRGEE